MNNLKHPNFILAIVSFIVLFIGIGMQANGNAAGFYVICAAVLLAAIHWIWSIVDVIRTPDMKPFQKRFWLIVVIAAPAVGSLFYYMLHQRSGKIVT